MPNYTWTPSGDFGPSTIHSLGPGHSASSLLTIPQACSPLFSLPSVSFLQTLTCLLPVPQDLCTCFLSALPEDACPLFITCIFSFIFLALSQKQLYEPDLATLKPNSLPCFPPKSSPASSGVGWRVFYVISQVVFSLLHVPWLAPTWNINSGLSGFRGACLGMSSVL